MFKLKYNFLALLQVIISLSNYFLLIKVFGVSEDTDAYFIVLAIFGSLILLQMLATEQFLFFYNDIKAINIKDAHNFYNIALTLSVFVAVTTFILSYFGGSFVLSFFISNSDNARMLLIETLFHIAIFELLVTPLQNINQKLMNAEMHFAAPYIINIIPTLFVLGTMICLYYLKIDDIKLLIYAKVTGSFFALVISFFIVKHINIPIKFRLKHQQLKYFIQNSFSMRFGHNIHNFLFTPITTNILTALPSGYASYFYYALKIATIVNGIVVGPSSKVFQSKFSKTWSQKQTKNAKKQIFVYMKIVIPLMIVSSLAVYFILPDALHFMTDKFTYESLNIINNLFLGLMIWQFVVLIESGSVLILAVEKKSQIFICTNLIFSLMYFGLANIFVDKFSIFSLIYSLIASQLVNFSTYGYYGRKILKQKLVTNES